MADRMPSDVSIHLSRRSPDPVHGGVSAADPGSVGQIFGFFLSLGLVLLLSAPLSAQDPPDATEEPEDSVTIEESEDGKLIFTINEQGTGMPLEQFIKLAERLTRRVFVYDQQTLNQAASQGGGTPDVKWLGPMELERDQFFDFFQTMLYTKKLALVPRGDPPFYQILGLNGTDRSEISSSAKYVATDEIPDYANATATMILTTVPLKHINATQASNSLRPFFAAAQAGGAGSFQIGTVGNQTAMLFQGFGPQVYAASQILTLVDTPEEVPEIQTRVVELIYAAAEELEPVLNEILNDPTRNRSPSNSGAGGGNLQPSQNQQIKIVRQGNSMILSGTQPQVIEALDLIARLDRPVENSETQARVVRLQNVLAEDLSQTLQQFLERDQAAEQQAQAGQSTTTRRPRPTVIRPHVESNSLLVSATASKYRDIHELIVELDKRQPQVLIEAAIVELSTNDLSRFGVELSFLDVSSGTDGYTRGFGLTSFGQSTFTDLDDDGIPDTRLPDFDNPLQGVTGGIIRGNGFAIPALLNAIATDDRANILSTPSVIVNNNQSAFVATTEQRPTTEVNSNASTSTQGVGSPREAGIELSISPSISRGNYLRLNIQLSVSRFLGAFDPNSPTGGGVIVTRDISTQITMPSEDTMVIGGVIEDQESESESGVPFLKDIPLLGYLFKSRTTETRKTNLYFFVTPTILDEEDFSDLSQVSLTKKLEADVYIGTRRMQLVDKKWTGMRPNLRPDKLEDRNTTVDDLDAFGSVEDPLYERPSRDGAGPARAAGTPTGPALPERR